MSDFMSSRDGAAVSKAIREAIKRVEVRTEVSTRSGSSWESPTVAVAVTLLLDGEEISTSNCSDSLPPPEKYS